jgi:hypothetical protein
VAGCDEDVLTSPKSGAESVLATRLRRGVGDGVADRESVLSSASEYCEPTDGSSSSDPSSGCSFSSLFALDLSLMSL